MSTVRRHRTAPAGSPFWLAAAAVVLAFAGPTSAVAVVVDSFTTNQATVTDPAGAGSSVATGGADILGTRRGLVPDLLSGAGPVSGGVAGGVLTATVAATTPDSRGEIVVTWDGDTNPNVLAPTGLGGVDLTGSNHSGFRIVVNSATAGSELVLEVYTDGGNASRAARRLPAVGASTSVFLSYASDFVPFLGTGAEFDDVGAIVLTVRGTETTTVLDLVETTTPLLAATKQDRTLADAPITGPVAPGATYKYRVEITNTGTEAQTVDLADTIEPNLTIATSTIDGTPALINDAYDTFGNIGETVAAPGLLGNDADPDQNGAPPALVVTAGVVPTALGGSATLAADGSFTYDPPIGVGDAVDTFPYTATDNEGNAAVARATIHIGPRIWFVDSSHGGTNQGTFQNPFTSITATNLNGASGVGDQDQPGDILFVYAGAGAYNVGLVLEADQQLIGQGSGLILQGETIVPAGSAPTFTNGAGSGITLATNNTLMGFTVGNTTVTDIVGSSFGTLTLSNVTLNGTGGALDLATGALDATFNSISSTNAPVHGINLNAATGTLTVAGSTSVTDAAQAGIRVVNGGSIYSFGATTLTSTGFGLDLSNNPTSTFNFTSIAVTTDAGAGLVAANSGTLNIGGSGNTIVATGGAAVDIASTSLGAGATFSTLSSTNSLGKGVNLDTVTGALTANGGAISNAAGACFDVNGGSSNINFAGTVSCSAASRLVEITGRTGGTVTLSGNLTATGSSQGILVQNNSVSGSPIINFSGATKSLNTGANAAVTLDNNDVATINFTNGGLDIDTTSGAGFNATAGAAGISVQGSGNSVTTTTGSAVRIVDSAIDPNDVTFQSITSTGAGASTAIELDDTGAGDFLLTGVGTTSGSGGTIDNKSVDAILLNNTDGLVSLRNLIVEDIGDTAGAIDTISGDDAIHGQQVDGGLVLEGVIIRRISDNAINGSLFAGGGATVWNGLTINNSTIEDSNRFHVASVGDANNEGMLRILGIRGVVSITNSTLQRGGEFLDFFVTAGTLALTATSSNFLTAYKEFTSGFLSSVGGHCIDVTVQGSGNANVTIGDRVNAALSNDFLNCRIGSIRIASDAGATGTVNTVIAGNQFTVDDHTSTLGGDFFFPMGGVLLGSINSTDSIVFNAVVDGNYFDEITNASGGVGQLTVAMHNGTWQVLAEDNTFDTPGNAPWFVRADSTTSARVLFRNNVGIKGAFCSPDPSAAGGGCNLGAGQLCPGAAGYCGPGLRSLVDLQNGAVVDFTAINDLFAEHDAGYDPGQTFEARTLNTGGGGTICLDLQNNQAPDGYSLEEFGGDFNLVGSGTCPVGSPSANCQTLLGNRGNRGGANVATTNPPFVNVEAGSTIDVVPGACLQPSGGIF